MKQLKIIVATLVLFSIASCVQETHEKNITFKVDMNAVDNAQNVGMKGDFTNPSWQKMIPLTDENNDGIYEVTIRQKTASNAIQFKFVNQNEHYELRDQPNRSLKLEYKPETITYETTFGVKEATITKK
jgi:1,4-alpha-glucan branching enzyme